MQTTIGSLERQSLTHAHHQLCDSSPGMMLGILQIIKPGNQLLYIHCQGKRESLNQNETKLLKALLKAALQWYALSSQVWVEHNWRFA